MAQQPSGELASTNPTKGTQDAGVQECGISPTISVRPCCHLQHLQRPAAPHLSKDAPGIPSLGHADLARGRGRSVIAIVVHDLSCLSFVNVTMPYRRLRWTTNLQTAL